VAGEGEQQPRSLVSGANAREHRLIVRRFLLDTVSDTGEAQTLADILGSS
jgi:hypothetical protein